MIDVLAYYTKVQLVTALEWNLPVQSQKDVRTEAQFSSLNDCNMRTYVNHFEYAAMVDFDEFIIPKSGANLLELIGVLYNDSIMKFQIFTYNIVETPYLNKIALFLIPDKVPKTTQKFGAYVFGNVFHYLYWKNDTTTMNQYWNSSLSDNSRMGRDYENKTRKLLNEGSLHIPYLITQMKVKRTFKPHPFGRRSKYIVRPEAVVMAGNHIVHKFVDGESNNLNRYIHKLHFT